MPAFTFTLPAVFQPGHYTACYLLAVATYQLLLLHEGWRRGFALRPWLLMQAATLLAFVVGCKLVVLPLAEWPALWLGGADLDTYPVRSALGGIAASSLVLLALRRWLGLGWAAFDAFVLPLALGLAVQCLGCLAAGCCWGELAGSYTPGLCFGPGTGPYLTQVAQGLLPAGAAHALPVVPTQLYALLICLALAGASWATRRRAWPAGTRYLLGTGVVLLAWGVLCQWRDPASQTLGAQSVVVFGVRLLAIQWGVLAAAAAHFAGAGGLLLWAAKSRLVKYLEVGFEGEASPAVRPARQLAGAAALLALTAALAPHALTGAEFRVLQVALGAVLLAEVIAWLPALSTASGHWQPRLGLAAALGLLVLMSQAPAPTARPDSARALDFSFGGVQGGFDQDVLYRESTSGGGCGGGAGTVVPPSRDGFRHRYQAVGGQVAYQFKPRNEGIIGTVGLGVWRGTDEVSYAPQALDGPLTFSGTTNQNRYALLSINPFVAGQTPAHFDISGLRFGYHLGLHIGTLTQTSTQRGEALLQPSTYVAPDAQVWAGNRERLFGQADMGFGLGSIGTYTYRLGIGSGLGSRKGGFVTAGYAFADYDPFRIVAENKGSQRLASQTPGTHQAFVAANIRLLNSGFSLEPTFATDFGPTNQATMKLHYRLKLR